MKLSFQKEIISITELATLAGMAQSTLSNILAGRRRPHPLKAKTLKTITGIKTDHWLYGTKTEIQHQFGIVGTQSEKEAALNALKKNIKHFKKKCKGKNSVITTKP